MTEDFLEEQEKGERGGERKKNKGASKRPSKTGKQAGLADAVETRDGDDVGVLR